MNEVYILTGNWYDYEVSDHWTVGVYEDAAEAETRRALLQSVATLVTPDMARTKRGHMRNLLAMDPDAKDHDDIEYLVEKALFIPRKK